MIGSRYGSNAATGLRYYLDTVRLQNALIVHASNFTLNPSDIWAGVSKELQRFGNPVRIHLHISFDKC
jgi:hypothetical protein